MALQAPRAHKVRTNIIAALLALLITTAATAHFRHMLLFYQESNVPAITANPVEFTKIYMVSKFRSNIGHWYAENAWDGESSRSMKHYFNAGQVDENGIPHRTQPFPGHPNIKIFAPFDGTISANKKERLPVGTQVFIASAKNADYYVRLFHIDLLFSLHVGSKVTSGQQVGTIGPKDGTDVSYEADTIYGKVVYLSILNHMTNQAFAPYAKMGYSRQSFVLTRAQADAKQHTCNGEQFTNNQGAYSTKGCYVNIRQYPYYKQQ